MSGHYQMLLVLSIAPAALAIEYGIRRAELAWDSRGPSLVDLLCDAALGAQDHTTCANPGCGQTICRCRRPAECIGATTLGCDHANPHGGDLCWDCRLECPACSAEDHAERMARIEADR